MTVLIIDLLEVIDIHHKDRERMFIAAGAFNIIGNPPLQLVAIVESGQRIMCRLMLKPFLNSFARFEFVVQLTGTPIDPCLQFGIEYMQLPLF